MTYRRAHHISCCTAVVCAVAMKRPDAATLPYDTLRVLNPFNVAPTFSGTNCLDLVQELVCGSQAGRGYRRSHAARPTGVRRASKPAEHGVS